MSVVAAHQIAADLLTAANHIERFGLEKGSYGSAGRPCCTRGAIQVAVYGHTVDEDEWRSTSQWHVNREGAATMQTNVFHPGQSTSQWSDAPGRDATEIVAALREAAEAAFPTDPPGRAPGGSTETGLAYMEASARFDGHGAARTEGEPS